MITNKQIYNINSHLDSMKDGEVRFFNEWQPEERYYILDLMRYGNDKPYILESNGSDKDIKTITKFRKREHFKPSYKQLNNKT